ncbi:MAG TPA: J domain-containing protein [Novosphingobium sp.]|nr:J domain-containing protein [Novosphingobium sp.]HMP57124.1 J domain-containing protein [Novosphingobium sp.]
MKFLLYLVLAVLACKLLLRRWPWELLASSSRNKAERKARALLGVKSGASREQVIEAHRRLIALVHPDRGGTNEQVHEANAARDVLLGALAGNDTENS